MAITGILLPMPRLGITPAASMKAFFYAPGTTTKQNTYTDSTLATPNSNPLSADSAGLFAAVYIDPALGYKVVLAPSTDTDPPIAPILTQDSAYLPAAYPFPLVCGGRPTLESGVGISNADQTAKATIYFTPYGPFGGRLALYNTTKLAWEMHAFTEVSLSLTGLAASTNYDLFVYDNAGTKTLEQVAWTSDTVRATAITTQDGVLVKTGSINKRYVGTFRTTGTIGQCEDSKAKRYVWSYYHRTRRPLAILEATDTWTYTLDTYRQANASGANQADMVIGVAEVMLDLAAIAQSTSGSADIARYTAIGEDSTTTAMTGQIHTWSYQGTAALFRATTRAEIRHYPAIGRHFYVWLERSAASGTTTWEGDTSDTSTHQNGMIGSIEG